MIGPGISPPRKVIDCFQDLKNRINGLDYFASSIGGGRDNVAYGSGCRLELQPKMPD